MDNIFNKISIVAGIIGGGLAKVLGGFDTLTCALITLMVLDYITGIIKSIFNKSLSSAVGYKGILKKLLILCMVCLSVVLQNILPDILPIREITIMFFLCNEGLSIIENSAEIVPFPKKLKEVLLQLRDENKITKDK
ncbi:MAG: holin family protein [Acutalibacteraceae bacterium]